jgi:hypothetical protein
MESVLARARSSAPTSGFIPAQLLSPWHRNYQHSPIFVLGVNQPTLYYRVFSLFESA